MEPSDKPPRPRKARKPRTKSSDALPRVDESAVELLRKELAEATRQLTEANEVLEAKQEALVAERSARAAGEEKAGEMLARIARSGERARLAEAALEEAVAGTEAQKKATAELEDSVARLWRELGVARREIDARVELMRKTEAQAADKAQAYEKRIAELEDRLRVARLPPTNPALPAARLAKALLAASETAQNHDEVEVLKAKLEEARAEARQMRENFEMLQTRAGKIGAGLREMRELMVQSAALFDDLEQREKAIAEVRAKSMREARDLFLRAAGKEHEIGKPPPPVPAVKSPIEDLSEAAELLEEEIRQSTRPPPPLEERPAPDDED